MAATLSSNLLGETSKIHIRVEAEPLAVTAEHAVTLCLIVNELATNVNQRRNPSLARECSKTLI